MKIIHVVTAFGIGGAEKLLLNIINRQVDNHNVSLIYLKPIDDLINRLDSRIIVKHIPLSFSTIIKLKKYYKAFKPDIIHTHLGHADLLGVWSAKSINGKVFSTIHSTSFSNNKLKDNFYFSLYRLVRRCSYIDWNIISISKSVRRKVGEKINIPQKNNHLLYNAIPKIESTESNHIKSSDICLLFVGRLSEEKSLDTLLKAVKYLKEKLKSKDFRLKIVGDGNLKCKLIQLTKTLKIENSVTFLGKHNEVNSFYEKSHIFILPSIWEGFGIVILEAFRAKIAVIASNVEGPAELIKNNENGLLFEPKNYKDLAEKLKLLIEDSTLRERLAKKGYESFTKDYHIDRYVEKLEKIYTNA